jgi:glucan phosphorylase
MASGIMFDPNALTIGFARRFASYKRSPLILQDLERLNGILNHPKHPLQIVFQERRILQTIQASRSLSRSLGAARNPDIGGGA